jgi:SHS2 domain-containing protein
MNFELLEHQADIGFRARGATAEALFAACAEALVAMILDVEGIRCSDEIGLAATGTDYESLMVNWLNEVLYWVDGRRVALGTFDVVRLDATHIECIARGEPRDAWRHPPKRIVKAVPIIS